VAVAWELEAEIVEVPGLTLHLDRGGLNVVVEVHQGQEVGFCEDAS